MIGPTTWVQHSWYGILRLLGWRFAGDLPTISKYVIIVAPHTSNWDFFLGILASWSCAIPHLHWIGKHTIFWGPAGTILRAMGGIPLDRTASRDLVQQTVDEFETRDALIIALAPEGTRGLTASWKSGFYHIAHDAQVPLVMVALDYRHKVITIGLPLLLSGEIPHDMAHVCEFYARHGRGRNPEQQGPVRLDSSVGQ